MALTRSRLWCVVSGEEAPVLGELREAARQFPALTFPGFDRGDLRRQFESDEE